jgi:hypothetical protein
MARVLIPVISCSEDCQYIANLERGLFVASSYAGSVMSPYTTLSAIPEPKIPETMQQRYCDWGGFRIMTAWNGNVPFTEEQYITWCRAIKPLWAATWDYPCNDSSISHKVVMSRQNETTLSAWFFWVHHSDEAFCWVPTVQGRDIEDYRWHARCLRPLIEQMQSFYREHNGEDNAFCVGIGSLVRRKAKIVKAIIETVAMELPGVKFHAWGVPYKVLKDPEAPLPDEVTSTDTSSYNGRIGKGIEKSKNSGMPQRQYTFEKAWPAYEEKVNRVASLPKQNGTLFDFMEDAI